MDRTGIFATLTEVFQDVFDSSTLTVDETTVAADVDGWDSLMHITLIQAIEDEFDVKFAMKEVIGFQNVGSIADAIVKHQ